MHREACRGCSGVSESFWGLDPFPGQLSGRCPPDTPSAIRLSRLDGPDILLKVHLTPATPPIPPTSPAFSPPASRPPTFVPQALTHLCESQPGHSLKPQHFFECLGGHSFKTSPSDFGFANPRFDGSDFKTVKSRICKSKKCVF